jgi:hypothetical protein
MTTSTTTNNNNAALPLELRKLQRRFLTTPKVCAGSIDKKEHADYNLPKDLVADAQIKISQTDEYLKSSSVSKEERYAIQAKLSDIKAHLHSTQKRETHSGNPNKQGPSSPPFLRKLSSRDSNNSQKENQVDDMFFKHDSSGAFNYSNSLRELTKSGSFSLLDSLPNPVTSCKAILKSAQEYSK